jgi:hypothetical protein
VLPTCHRLILYMQSPIVGINRCYIKYLPKGLSYSVYMLENGGKYLEYTVYREYDIYKAYSHKTVDLPYSHQTVDLPYSHKRVDLPYSHKTVDLPYSHKTVDLPYSLPSCYWILIYSIQICSIRLIISVWSWCPDPLNILYMSNCIVISLKYFYSCRLSKSVLLISVNTFLYLFY